MGKKGLPLFIVYNFIILFLEISFRILCTSKIIRISLINTIIFTILVSFILTLLTTLFNKKINMILSNIFIFIITFYFTVEIIFYRIFNVFFSIEALALAENLKSFFSDTLKLIGSNIIVIIVLFIPFILSIIFRKKINYQKTNIYNKIIYLLIILISILAFYSGLYIKKSQTNSIYNLYYNIDNISLYKEKVGVLPSLYLELKRLIFGFEETIMVSNEETNEINDTDIDEEIEEIKYNNLDIDFNSLIEKANSNTIKNMHEYFSKEPGSLQNEYTSLFKGKNLILFMAESFNSIAVDETLTPTIYKLANSSFVFDNFYSPVILSTIGGEFQELTGLYPDLSLLSSIWRKGNQNYKFGIANLFKELGYNTFAYHNNTYSFQNRNKYLKSIGFDKYLGCKNGLESRINCNTWPQSDVEMIDNTVSDYINSDKPFMVYYATVSGHMDYNWSNAMSRKNKDAVNDLPYSLSVKAYLASQIELDHALKSLIEKLSEANKLDDTVLALVGDHYPYALSLDEINEVSTYKRDNIVEINRSNFILWNINQETIHIDKVASQIDVLPTLLNLFGIEYDSRLITGKDILSNSPGFAIFKDQSWVSDYGTYISSSGKFSLKDGKTLPENYISKTNNLIQNRVKMSKLLLQNNYYNLVINSINSTN